MKETGQEVVSVVIRRLSVVGHKSKNVIRVVSRYVRLPACGATPTLKPQFVTMTVHERVGEIREQMMSKHTLMHDGGV